MFSRPGEKSSGVPLKGALWVRQGLCRAAVSNGAAATLFRDENNRHGSFLAVAAFQDEPLRSEKCTVQRANAPSALTLPRDLSNTLSSATSQRLVGGNDASGESKPSLRLQLYSVVGLDTGSPSCLFLQSIPLPFAVQRQEPLQQDRKPAPDPLALVVEKIVWAGPTTVAVMNALGEVLVCKTGLRYTMEGSDSEPTSDGDMDSSASSIGDDDNVDGAVDEPHRGVPMRFNRVSDIAAACIVDSASHTATAVLCMAGVRSVKALHVEVPLSARNAGNAANGGADVLEWSLGPFHSIALQPHPVCRSNAEKKGERRQTFLLAGCTTGGTVQLHEWNPKDECNGSQRGGVPAVIGQVLMGPQTTFWGLAAGVHDGRCVFAALGTSAKRVNGSKGSAATSNGELSASPAEVPSLLSLRGKDGKRLAVDAYFPRTEAETGACGERAPLNDVYALLHRRDDPIPPDAPHHRSTLDDIASAVRVAPPVWSMDGNACAEMFLLSLSVDGNCAGGAAKVCNPCVSRYGSLTADAANLAALQKLKGEPLRLSPSIVAKACSGGGSAFALLIHSSTAVLSFTATLTENALVTKPGAFYEVGAAVNRVLVAADICAPTTAVEQAEREATHLTILLLTGAEADSLPDTAPKEATVFQRHGDGDRRKQLAVSSLTLMAVSEKECELHQEGDLDEVAVAPPAITSVDPEAFRALVRAVVQEENAKLLAHMNTRMDSLEGKIDCLLQRLSSLT